MTGKLVRWKFVNAKTGEPNVSCEGQIVHVSVVQTSGKVEAWAVIQTVDGGFQCQPITSLIEISSGDDLLVGPVVGASKTLAAVRDLGLPYDPDDDMDSQLADLLTNLAAELKEVGDERDKLVGVTGLPQKKKKLL
jgi:hypothetical protein